MLTLLHLCDSLFPIGAFAYSDGLEWAAVAGKATEGSGLRAWLDTMLDESFARAEGPAVWHAWRAVQDDDVSTLATLDEELNALRPAAATRKASRAMGLRLLTTWHALHPDPLTGRLLDLARAGRLGPTLPVAFAAACASSCVEQRTAAEAFAYTRVASTVSAALRLLAIGQTEGHAVLARALERVPALVDAIAVRPARPESFAPAMDIAAMSQQYLHSRLFRT